MLTDLQRISVGEVNDDFFTSNLDASAPIFCPTSSVRCVTGFGDFPTNFNLTYSNLQGISEACHFDEFKLEIAKSRHISCIVIVETWLRRGVNQNKTCDIPGYTLHRSDRHSRKNDRNKGGGVAVYVANGLKVNTVERSFLNDHGISGSEFIFLEIQTEISKILICGIYRTNGCNKTNTERLFELINNSSAKYDNVISYNRLSVSEILVRLIWIN